MSVARRRPSDRVVDREIESHRSTMRTEQCRGGSSEEPGSSGGGTDEGPPRPPDENHCPAVGRSTVMATPRRTAADGDAIDEGAGGYRRYQY